MAWLTACGGGGGGGGIIAVPAPGPAPAPPAISAQPTALTVPDGASASFGVTASGSGTLSYQWRRNGAAISGATAASYSTPVLSLADSGASFSVDVTDAIGTTPSSGASVTVQALAPTISAGPDNLTVSAGQDAVFSVQAAGSATLQYQWRRNGVDISGANAASYTLPSAATGDNGASISVLVSNAAGSVTSAAATLTVNAADAPGLITFLQIGVVGERQALTIYANISGTPPFSYQWLRNGVPIPGASGITNGNQVSYATPALLAIDDGVRYRLEVTNSSGTVQGNEVRFSVIGAAAVAGGESHSLAMSTAGSVFAWGENSAGQLGLGDSQPRLEPTAVGGLNGVVAVAAGRAHSLALRGDGSVVAWGANGQGQLGLGTQTGHDTPQAINGLANVVAIAAAGDQSFAVRSDGTLWAWGDNDVGQLGDGSNADRLQPVQVMALANASAIIVAVAAGPAHTLAVDANGTVWAWGDNTYGQHGDTLVGARNAPVQVAGLSGIAGVAAGAGFSVAVDLNARLWTWGRNGSSQLGDGGTANRALPQQITTTVGGAALPPVIRIEAGNDHALALPFAGAPLAWGSNALGQLGNGTVGGTRTAPGPLSGTPSGLRSIAAGPGHSLVRANAGSVYGWGVNSAGQIGNGASGAPVTQPVPANNLSLN